MVSMVSRLFGSLLVGSCLLSLSLVFFSLAGLIGLLPRFLRLLLIGLRGFLILSFRFYHLVFSRLAPIIQLHLGFDILNGHSRLAASPLLSLALGLLIMLLTSLPVNGWGVGLSLLHGLFVGLAWDEIAEPGGLQLGVKIE